MQLFLQNTTRMILFYVIRTCLLTQSFYGCIHTALRKGYLRESMLTPHYTGIQEVGVLFIRDGRKKILTVKLMYDIVNMGLA